MKPTDYDDNVDARRHDRYATWLYTDVERAVFDAILARAVREKCCIGLNMPGQREYLERELAAVDGALPTDDPLVVAALANGEVAFRNGVADRIWLEHQSEFEIARRPELLNADRY